jgi:endonuclease/exonuclease/phosphatase family metal-dependent hydrolase
VRLLDKDVALVREDVRVTESTKGRYAATLPLEGLGMEIPRGYVSIEAGVGQRKVRFVTTHLESATDLIRIPQAEELDKILGDERLPTIVVGDFNTLDPGPNNPLNDGTYQYLTGAAGLRDAWLLRAGHPNDRGFTSPHAPDLRNAPANLYERIDLVFLKNFPQTRGRGHHGSLQAEVIGEEEEDRTSSGMWPSDHAGVVVTLDGKIAD